MKKNKELHDQKLIKNLLIECILIAFLILSITQISAVESNATKLSIIKNNSPLYAIRVKNVINNKEVKINSHYIGKGRECIIPTSKNWSKLNIQQWPTASCTIRYPIPTCHLLLCKITTGPICQLITTKLICRTLTLKICE